MNATLAVGGGIGLLLALFGAVMLVTGRAPAGTMRMFAEVRDAGLYHLLFGVGLLVMVVSQALLRGPAAVAVGVVALALAVVALVKYRPRKRGSV
ncbi:hypothetical protein [Symbioplanes lichenis]|uniref:hypothetical protein n=1 Tax=Symbioplanes lichenis TaxID=1629072 RepID=UPI0027390D8A|nr:hypothetical protein [Actinoplanes lichenis]